MSAISRLNFEIQEKINQLHIEGHSPSKIVELIFETFNYKVSEYWVRQQIVEVSN